MPYVLSHELDRIVQQKISTGEYRSEEEVLLRALNALDERDAVLAGVQEGYEDFEAGQYQTLGEMDAQLRAKYGIPED